MRGIEVINKPEPSEVPTGTTANFDESIRVLLIDDQAIVGESVRRLLAHEPSISFRYCGDPNQAIDQAKETKATVILQDLVMPDIDGLDLVRCFRACSEAARIPIIVLSTKEDPAIKSEAFAAGANDYLIKLPDKIELVARIRHHSSAYLNQIQRDEAYRALRESQQQLLESNKSLVALNLELETANAEILSSNDRIKKDLESAARIQAALLPASFPDVHGVRFAWNFRPCDELAGDSLNVFRLDEQHIGLYLLDVSSHGVPAALLAVMLSRVMSPVMSQSSLLKQHCSNPLGYRLVPPAEVAAQLNRQFPMTSTNGQYFTILYGVLDLQTRVLRYVQAGHPKPCRSSCQPTGGSPIRGRYTHRVY
jgi:phosphoserine phosphatase RsbU/P